MAQKGQGDHYYNTDYKFSPRVREMLAKKLGDKEMSYMRAENIIMSVMKGDYKETLTDLNDKDKTKLMSLLKHNSSTNLPRKNVDVVVSFLKDNYTVDESKEYVDHMLGLYKPGMVYAGVKISNHTVLNFLEEMQTYPLMKGIIINKKYINDLMSFFDRDADEFDFDLQTLMVEKDFTEEMLQVFVNISDGTDLRFHNDDDVFILGTFEEETEKYLVETFKYLEVQSIPVHLFKWISDVSEVAEVIIEETPSEIDGNVSDISIQESDMSALPPTDIPKDTLFESSKPKDILINGYGYGKSDITFLDDFYSIGLVKDGKVLIRSFNTDGAVFIHKLKKTKKFIKGDDINAIKNGSVEFLILRNFVGEINLIVTVNTYDENDKELTFPVKPGDYSGNDIYYELTKKYEDLYDDADINIVLDINGTFDNSEDLTMDIYNSL